MLTVIAVLRQCEPAEAGCWKTNFSCTISLAPWLGYSKEPQIRLVKAGF